MKRKAFLILYSFCFLLCFFLGMSSSDNLSDTKTAEPKDAEKEKPEVDINKGWKTGRTRRQRFQRASSQQKQVLSKQEYASKMPTGLKEREESSSGREMKNDRMEEDRKDSKILRHNRNVEEPMKALKENEQEEEPKVEQMPESERQTVHTTDAAKEEMRNKEKLPYDISGKTFICSTFSSNANDSPNVYHLLTFVR